MPQIPQCPRCGGRNRVTNEHGGLTWTKDGDYWCDRCCGWLSSLSPLPGRHTPDDVGPPLTKRKRYRKGATPRLTGEAQERGTPLDNKRRAR